MTSTTLSKTERLKQYTPLLAQGHGARRISRETDIPLGTVKSDLSRLRNKGRTATLPARRSKKTLIATPMQPTPSSPAFDWTANMDRLGPIVNSIIDEAGTPTEDRRMWIETFGRLFAKRIQAERIQFFLHPDGTQEASVPMAVSRPMLVEALKREDVGPDCLLCGRPKSRMLKGVCEVEK